MTEKTNQLQILVAESGLDESQASDIVKAFGGPFEEASSILADFDYDEEGNLIVGENAIVVTDENDKEGMKKAEEYRKTVKKARTTIDNKRTELKADYLKKGNAIQKIANELRDKLKPVEEYLESQEKFAKILEEKRAAEKLSNRLQQLGSFEVDTSIYNVELMTDDAFAALVVKLQDDADREAQSKHEAEVKAAEEAEAERKRQAEIEAENARLKAEAEEKEKRNASIRDRINKVTALGLVWNETSVAYVRGELAVTPEHLKEYNDEVFGQLLDHITFTIGEEMRIENEKQAKLKAEEDERLAKERAQAEADRQERERLQKEADDRAVAERKAKQEAEAAEHAALLAPDKDKISIFLSDVEAITNYAPAVTSKEALFIIEQIKSSIQAAINTAKEQMEKL